MIAFINAFFAGSWLSIFWNWIWNTCMVGGTQGLWSLYLMTTGHGGFWWSTLAVFVWVTIVTAILCYWVLVFFCLYVPWLGCAMVWLVSWLILIICKVIIWAVILLLHFGVWIWSWFWPLCIWIFKKGVFVMKWIVILFMPGFFIGSGIEEIYLNTKNWLGENIYPIAMFTFLITLIIVPTAWIGWTIYYIATTILFNHIAITAPKPSAAT